jgi:autotransporter-associated beta strand protein
MLFLFPAQLVTYAGSATWNSNPTSGNWATAANWTPNTIPDGADDIASFGSSSETHITVMNADPVEVSEILFNSGADPFTITADEASLIISGAGIINNSGVTQNFVSPAAGPTLAWHLFFENSATAGDSTVFTNNGASPSQNASSTIFTGSSNAGSAKFYNLVVKTGLPGGGGGVVAFEDSSSAANGTFISQGNTHAGGQGGAVEFFNTSTAGEGIFLYEGGKGSQGYGGLTQFFDSSSAGNAVFTINGGTVSDAYGGSVTFYTTSTAANATLIAKGGVNGGLGGEIRFTDGSSGGSCRVELFGNGTLNVDTWDAPRAEIGSLEGDGDVTFMRGKSLTVGNNNLDTTFGGVISGEGALTKVGSGKLTLAGANTYTVGTTVKRGELRVTNASGSGTGTATVVVIGSTLSGSGTISGTVTVGTDSGRPAMLVPGKSGAPGTLTIQSGLILYSSAVYLCRLNSNSATAGSVACRGVVIYNGAIFSGTDLTSGTLAPGTVFTVINNTATTAVVGTFSNLADGSTTTIGTNTFQANYEGGDGNDLTLTVVP